MGITRQRMARWLQEPLLVLALALCAMAASVPLELDINSQEELLAVSALDHSLEDPEPEGTNKATCWRLRSLVRSNGPRQGYEWTLTKFELVASSDASGDPLTGEVETSSVKEETDEAGEVTSPNDGAKAFDGLDTTNWQANGMDGGEYIGLKLADATEVRSVKIQQKDELLVEYSRSEAEWTSTCALEC